MNIIQPGDEGTKTNSQKFFEKFDDLPIVQELVAHIKNKLHRLPEDVILISLAARMYQDYPPKSARWITTTPANSIHCELQFADARYHYFYRTKPI